MLGKGRLLVVQWGCLGFSKAIMVFGGTWRSSQPFIHSSSFYWVTTMYQIKCWVLDSMVCEREIRHHFSSRGVERKTSRTTRPGSVNFPFWAVSTEEKLERTGRADEYQELKESCLELVMAALISKEWLSCCPHGWAWGRETIGGGTDKKVIEL